MSFCSNACGRDETTAITFTIHGLWRRVFRSGISFRSSQIAVDVTLDTVVQCRQLELIHHFGVGLLRGSVNCLEVEEGFRMGNQHWFSLFDNV